MIDSSIFRMGGLALMTLTLWGCPGETEKIECGPPIASAGEDVAGVTGQRIILRGSFRLPPEEFAACQKGLETIGFAWEQTGGPDVTLEGADQIEASFIPTVAGDYTFRAKATYPDAVRPELAESQWDSVQAQVAQRFCDPPAADAGLPQLVAYEGQPVTVQLDGSRSHPDSGCPELELIAYDWTVESQPAGADVQIAAGVGGLASFSAEVPGDYRLQLQVQDSLGADGRVDTATASVLIQVVERTPCEDTLEVEVVSAIGAQVIVGAAVTVIDAAGASHQGLTSGAGLATFSGLAPGRRQAITVSTDETVSALPGSGDPNPRPRHQVVSVLDHCSARLTIPVPLTASGQAAGSRGLVVAKVPRTLFDWLPHSQRYAGSCATDGDCKIGYRCLDTPMGDKQCTPRSLLPVFGLDDPDISGQFRGVMLIPVLPQDSAARFPLGKLLAPPLSPDAILPGNMASDDAFLNGLAPGLGIDVWGEACTTVANCPNATDFACEPDNTGAMRCKDVTPLHNLKLDVTASNATQLMLLVAVVNVGMENLLPILSSFLSSGDEELEFDVGGLLGAFRLRTLYACPLSVPTTAGAETDISARLATLGPDDCWAVGYQQQESVEPVLGVTDSSVTCQADADCGWPSENLRCLDNPEQPGSKSCFVPLYRVRIVSEDELIVSPAIDGVQPTAGDYDSRVCAQLPDTARVQKLCPSAGGGPMPCDPAVWCDLSTPADTECSLPYGVAVVTADFPAGHSGFPAGGRAVLGFQFNRSPLSSDLSPRFLVPPLGDMGADQLSAVQLLFRNVALMPEGNYQTLPGLNAVARTVRSSSTGLDLPAHLAWAGTSAPTDAGLTIKVSVDPVDPTAECAAMTAERAWAVAQRLAAPQAGAQDLPTSLTLAQPAASGLMALSLSKIDRIVTAEGKAFTYRDPQWQLYLPAGSTTAALPAGASPFASGVEVWLAVESLGFPVPFDYDLFPAGLVSTGSISLSADHRAVVAP